MFERLVLPLRDRRTVRLDADLADATNAHAYRRHTYVFDDVDIVLLEEIFLVNAILKLKRRNPRLGARALR